MCWLPRSTSLRVEGSTVVRFRGPGRRINNLDDWRKNGAERREGLKALPYEG